MCAQGGLGHQSADQRLATKCSPEVIQFLKEQGLEWLESTFAHHQIVDMEMMGSMDVESLRAILGQLAFMAELIWQPLHTTPTAESVMTRGAYACWFTGVATAVRSHWPNMYECTDDTAAQRACGRADVADGRSQRRPDRDRGRVAEHQRAWQAPNR